MSTDVTLSDRQESILVYIIRYLRENKIPPSIRNIGEAGSSPAPLWSTTI